MNEMPMTIISRLARVEAPPERLREPLSEAQLQEQSAQEALRRNALAETLANTRPRRAYSAVVVTGLARIVELALLTAAGFAVHRLYVAAPLSFEYAVAIPRSR